MKKESRTVGELIDLLGEVDPSLEIEFWSVSVYGQFDSTDKILWSRLCDSTSYMNFMDCHEKAIRKCVSILCPNPYIPERMICQSIRDAVGHKSRLKALKMAAKKPLKQWAIEDLMLLFGVGVKTAGKMLIKIHSA